MSSERVAELVNQGSTLSNPHQFDGLVYSLNQELLYGNPPLEDERLGYGYLRSLVTHPDGRTSDLARASLERRWMKVGFYTRQDQDRISFRGNNRPFFEEVTESFGSRLSDPAKLAILELAKLRDVPRRRLADILTTLVGVRTDPSAIIQEIGKLHVLTDDLCFVPLAQTLHSRVVMDPAAYTVLEPHLSILALISYPDQTISQKDKNLAQATKREIANALKVATKFFRGENVEGITFPAEPHYFLPSINMLDHEFRERQSPRGNRASEQKISFLAKDGALYTLLHRDSSTRVVISKHPEGTEEQLVLNFWDRQVRREEVGTFSIGAIHGGSADIEADGILMKLMPKQIQSANSVAISSMEMTIQWDDLSGKGQKVYTIAHYQKSGATSVTDKYDTNNYVATEATSITVPETIQEKSLAFPNLRTHSKQIIFDKPEDIVQVIHPDGDYTVTYKKTKKGVKVSLRGKGWENELFLPSGLNPAKMVKVLREKFGSIAEEVTVNQEEIREQVANVRRLTLAEHIYLSRFRSLPEHDVISSYFGEEAYQRVNTVDEGLASLDEEARWCALYYMMSLASLRDHMPIAEQVARDLGKDTQDPRLEFRSFINKNTIMIPEELLLLAEEIFMPEEFRRW